MEYLRTRQGKAHRCSPWRLHLGLIPGQAPAFPSEVRVSPWAAKTTFPSLLEDLFIAPLRNSCGPYKLGKHRKVEKANTANYSQLSINPDLKKRSLGASWVVQR